MVQSVWLPLIALTAILSAPVPIFTAGGNGLEAPLKTSPWEVPTADWDQTVWTRYRDLDDTVNELNVLSSTYPHICKLFNLSAMFPYPGGAPRYSIEDRTIWGLKISDEPDVNDTEEPEMFYCAMTHAREWISNEVLMYFINYVLRNYRSNSTVSSLVNSTELWFVPVVNPDGFQESIEQDDFNSSYGIYGWRKNVNETNGSPGFQNYGSAQGDGTDINRNFGFKWGYPGSSTDPDFPTYRGSAAFSEPETQIIHELFKSRDFTMAVSFHSYSGLNLYPWGYTSDPALDAALLSGIAQVMSGINGYMAQPGASLYPTSGDFVDYVYGTYRVPSFTVEINHRNVRFIPEISKISEDCHLNREVCFLLAGLSHDPYSVFNVGINGTVVDTLGRSVGGASINIKGMNRDLNLTTSDAGAFNLSLEPGMYDVIIRKGDLYNASLTTVPAGRYLEVTYLMGDTVPPVISAVNISLSGIGAQAAEWGEKVVVTVRELYDEQNLTGVVEVYDPGWIGPLAVFDLEQNGTLYQAVWDTRAFEPQKVYGLEAKLADEFANWDMDGSDPHGLDLLVNLNDTLPPSIYNITLGGARNPDGSFESGSTIRVMADVEGGSTWETGLNLTATIGSGTTLLMAVPLEWQPVTDRYHSDIDTWALPLGEHDLTVKAFDRFGNGVTARPVPFRLSDTTPPGFILYLGNYQTGAFVSGTRMVFIIKPLEMEQGLNASLTIEGPDGLDLSPDGPSFDPENGTFGFEWDSQNMPTGLYHAEGRLSDSEGNFLPDGAQEGHDLSFTMLDLTPPEVLSLTVGTTDVTGPMTINATDNTSLSVIPKEWEEGMECSLQWTVVGRSKGGYVNMTHIGTSRFECILSADGMDGFGQYNIEVRLSDRFDNFDPDGLLPDFDLVLNLKRPEPRFLNASARNVDHGEVWAPNRTEWVLEGEVIELSCKLENLTEGDHLELFFNSQWRTVEHVIDRVDRTSTAVHMWNTTGRTGAFNLTWKAVPFSSPLVSSWTFRCMVMPSERGHVKDMTVTGHHRSGNDTLMVNLSWEPPEGSLSLVMVTKRIMDGNWTVHSTFELTPDRTNGSFGVPWEDMEFLLIARHRLFPEGTDRELEMGDFYVDVEGTSKATFKAPERPEVVVEDTPGDDDGGGWYLSAGLGAVILLIIIVLLSVLLLGRRGRSTTVPVDAWEE